MHWHKVYISYVTWLLYIVATTIGLLHIQAWQFVLHSAYKDRLGWEEDDNSLDFYHLTFWERYKGQWQLSHNTPLRTKLIDAHRDRRN